MKTIKQAYTKCREKAIQSYSKLLQPVFFGILVAGSCDFRYRHRFLRENHPGARREDLQSEEIG